MSVPMFGDAPVELVLIVPVLPVGRNATGQRVAQARPRGVDGVSTVGQVREGIDLPRREVAADRQIQTSGEQALGPQPRPVLERRHAERLDEPHATAVIAGDGPRSAELMREMIENLPEADPIFSAEEFTDQPMRSLAAEIVREKILETTGEEIPYVTAVVTERWEEVREDFTRIYCAIFVERESQKKIIIGRRAQRLKQVGTRARRDIERMLGHRCHLELFVKVEEDWRDQQRLLDEMGISR